MIVTSGSLQAEYAKEYGLGVVVDGNSDIDADIKGFLSTFDYKVFCQKCNDLLSLFIEDHNVLQKTIAAFVGA
jgi:hypothetical protein